MKTIELEDLVRVMRNVFNAPKADITRESTSKTVLGWDSIAHVILMLEIEEELGVAVTPQEAASMTNVGELLDELRRRQESATP